MRKTDLHVGKIIYFGTKTGPRTRARIHALSSKSVTVVSTSKRGDKPAGSKWRIGYENIFDSKGLRSRLKPTKGFRDARKRKAAARLKKSKQRVWSYTGVTSTGKRLKSKVLASSKAEAVAKAKRQIPFKGRPLVTTMRRN